MIALSPMPSFSSSPGEASLWSRLSPSLFLARLPGGVVYTCGFHVLIFSGTDAPSLDGAWELGEGPSETPLPQPPTPLVSSPAEAHQVCGGAGKEAGSPRGKNIGWGVRWAWGHCHLLDGDSGWSLHLRHPLCFLISMVG